MLLLLITVLLISDLISDRDKEIQYVVKVLVISHSAI